MTRISDLSDVDEQYLTSRHADYRQTPAAEKEAFREQCAKHIIASRALNLEDGYILDLFLTKVRNWFQNNAPVKKARLPLKINHDFTAERVWGMLHQDEIRDGLLKSRPPNVAEDAPHVVIWNAKRKQMWSKVSADDKAVYERLAAKWSEEGPDDDLKPEMAERRAVAWMKAIALLFWQQCRMPIFIYGCFEDTKAQLQGATFDTSLLFEDTKDGKGKPTFRQNKEWATDFRRWFYEYFTPYVRPDLASPDAMEYLRTKSKKVVEPFDFETTEDGWPLLPKGDDVSHTRRQEILRQWFRELYGLACGREVLSVPWSSIVKKPQQFFSPGMLPKDFHIDDPSHIRRQDVIDFYKHVQTIQTPPTNATAQLPPRFQFSNFEEGPENARRYPEAINSGEVEAWQPRRAKKKVPPPTFDAPPGATDDEEEPEGDNGPPPAKRGAGRGRFNPGPKFYKDVKRIQRENDRAKARNAKAKAKAEKKARKAKAKGKGKGKGKRRASSEEDFSISDEEFSAEEEEDDFDAMDNDVPEEDTEEDLSSGDERSPMGADDADADADSGNEVEEALERYEDVLSSSAVRKNAPPSAGPSRLPRDEDSASIARRPGATAAPRGSVGETGAAALPSVAASSALSAAHRAAEEPSAAPSTSRSPHLRDPRSPDAGVEQSGWTLPPDADVAPCDVPQDGPSRLAYLRGLSNDRTYGEMLQRAETLLSETTAIRVQPPLFWASWGYKSPFLPKDAHAGEKAPKALRGILKFLAKGPPKTGGAMEAQRYCLVMGLVLHDIMALQFVEPGEEWPERLPVYLATSELSFDELQPLLDACDLAFRTPLLPSTRDARSTASSLPAASTSAGVPRDAAPAPSPTVGGRSSPAPGVAMRSRKGGAADEPEPTAPSPPEPPTSSVQPKAKATGRAKVTGKAKAKAQHPTSGEEPRESDSAPTQRRRARGALTHADEGGDSTVGGAESAPKQAPRRSTRLRP